MATYKAGLFFSLCAGLIAGSYAEAQEFFVRDRNVAVTDRPQPQFDPEPLRLRSFVARPVLTLGVAADTNVFAEDTDTEADVLFLINPELDVTSDWSRHQLGANVSVDHEQFIDLNTEDNTDIRGSVRGRLDVGREFFVTGRAFGSRLNESRRAISTGAGFDDRVQFRQFGGVVGSTYRRSRLEARASYQIVDTEFDDVEALDGTILDQSFRDNLFQEVTGRLSYAVTRDIAVFGQASYNIEDFDELSLVGPDLLNRDSNGFALQAGVNFEVDAPFRGDVAVGYFERDRDDPGFEDFSGVSIDGRLMWFPTQLTTVTVNGFRRATDTGIQDIAGATDTGGGIRVDHELRRNVLLFSSVNFRDTDFEDFDRNDFNTNFNLGATYRLNRHVHLGAFYNLFRRSSTLETEEFTQNIVGLRVSLYP